MTRNPIIKCPYCDTVNYLNLNVPESVKLYGPGVLETICGRCGKKIGVKADDIKYENRESAEERVKK